MDVGSKIGRFFSGSKGPSRGLSFSLMVCRQGLRGIASFLVVLTHLARAWDYDLFAPRDEEDVDARVLQWPVLRLPWQGRIGVTIFAFLTGYVCALKPTKQARAGDVSDIIYSISRACSANGLGRTNLNYLKPTMGLHGKVKCT